MIEQRKEYPALVEALYLKSSELNRGDIFPHHEIEEIISVSRYNDRPTYQLLVEKWRRQLLEDRGIATLPVHGVGYELLTLQRQVKDYDEIRLKKAGRQLRKAARALKALPDEDLDTNQRSLKHVKLKMLQQSREQLRQKARMDEAFARPQQRNPIPPTPDQLAEITY